MRAYALLLGVLLTGVSAYLAQLAVKSAGFERLREPAPAALDQLEPDMKIWYGGVLDPIKIEARRGIPPTMVFRAPMRIAAAKVETRCPHSNQLKTVTALRS